MGDALLFTSMIVIGASMMAACVVPFMFMLMNRASDALIVLGGVVSLVFMFFASVFWLQLTMWVFS